ncbi:MAG: dihydrofolate reductase [Wenzhouxiangellaceae bacterium]|nr:dihydrofolate reductase [Wenzhouxiangellaceae bacterium]
MSSAKSGRDSPGTSQVVLVAAMGRNRVIGVDGGMPWHLPADLKHFKQLTLGHPVIMGRRTFESIGKPLPGRRNIVLSGSLKQAPAGCDRVDSLDEALASVDRETVMVIGGGQLYRQALPIATRLELTFIDAEPEGDTHFPQWSRGDWMPVETTVRPADADNPFRLVFCSLVRVDDWKHTLETTT